MFLTSLLASRSSATLAGTPAPAVGALWCSAFRPFFLLGAAYGPLLMAYSLGVAAGLWPLPAGGLSLRAWHGHEIVFGFAAAVIVGIVLTALPSWAHTEEIDGARLQWLAGLWLAGRVAMALPLPPVLVAALDCALYPALAWMVAPQLLRVANRRYLLLLPVLAALLAANILFHVGRATADEASGLLGLRMAVYAVILLYALKAGVFTPVFTGNALREKGRGDQAPFLPWLDALAVASVIALAVADLAGLPAAAIGAAAAAACAVHAVRLARWRGWRVADVPLLLVMHLGYAWLVVAFGLKAAAELGGGVPEPAWLHAFTVGALGMTMIGMMTRVALRHTGRPLRVPPSLLLAFALMFAAGLLRMAIALDMLGPSWLAVSALFWASVFLVYLGRCANMLRRPSLPRGKGAAPAR
jgi:uncharacterized protein involved in response to NO